MRPASSWAGMPVMLTLPAPSVSRIISGRISLSRRRALSSTCQARKRPLLSGVLPPTGRSRKRLLGQLHAAGGGQDEAGLVALEDDQANLVAALVGIDQQAEDGALGGLHAFAGRHAPAGIDDKEDQVAGAAHAHLALQVALAQLEGEVVFASRVALALVGGGGAQRGVEGDVLGAGRRPGAP